MSKVVDSKLHSSVAASKSSGSSLDSNQGFRQYFLATLVLLIGVSLTWSATRDGLYSARREAQSEFVTDAELFISLLNSEVYHDIESSQSFRAFFKVAENPLDQFQDFVTLNMSSRPNRHVVAIVLDKSENDLLVMKNVWSTNQALSQKLEGVSLADFGSIKSNYDSKGKGASIIPLTAEEAAYFNLQRAIMMITPFGEQNEIFGDIIEIVDINGVISRIGGDDRFADLGMQLETTDSTGRVHSATRLALGEYELSKVHAEPNAFFHTQFIHSPVMSWSATIWSSPGRYPIDYGRPAITFIASIVLTGLVVFIVWSQSLRSRRIVEVVERRTRALKKAHMDLEQQNRLLRDLNSDLSVARHAAETANRAKSEFLATVSHELRTPLNAILGFSELLFQQTLGPIHDDRYVEYAKDIHGSGTHLLSLINDILDLAKLEADKLKIERDAVSPYALVDKLKSLLGQQASAKSLELAVEVSEDMPASFIGDMLRIQQIGINLATNAIKFTEKGSVHIKIFRQALDDSREGWILEVTDTGVGIPEYKLQTLFDRFTQVDSALSRRYGGVGLGLAICRELVKRMNGGIHVTSTVGVGTRIWIHLPLEEGLGSDHDCAADTI